MRISLFSTLNRISVNIFLLFTLISSLSRTKFTFLSKSSSQPSSTPMLRLDGPHEKRIRVSKRMRLFLMPNEYKIVFIIHHLIRAIQKSFLSQAVCFDKRSALPSFGLVGGREWQGLHQ